MLKIKNLKAKAKETEILKGIDLEIKPGEVHVVMGPNGSGKSTLAQVIAGSPFYKVESGQLTVNGKNLIKLTPDKRAKLGIFIGFQNPVEIPGVSVFNVMRKASQANQSVILNGVKNLKSKKRSFADAQDDKKSNGQSPAKGQTFNKGVAPSLRSGLKLAEFRQQLLEYASSLKLSSDHLSRSFNEGFSGGEKKRNEILQMLALKPKLVILDEIDSGLDVDGLRIVASAIKKFTMVNSRSSLVIITHYARILKYIKADFVHVMSDGKIVKSGKHKLAGEIEEKGYQGMTI